MEELESFNIKGKSNNNDGPVCDWFCWRYPLPSGGEDVKDVFDVSIKSNLHILTTLILPKLFIKLKEYIYATR